MEDIKYIGDMVQSVLYEFGGIITTLIGLVGLLKLLKEQMKRYTFSKNLTANSQKSLMICLSKSNSGLLPSKSPLFTSTNLSQLRDKVLLE